jgi:glycolate oxidase FAD binding subunit
MKISGDALSAKLEGELDAGAVEHASASLAAHSADGKNPSLVCFPSTPEQAGSVLRICAEAEAAVIPWGGGTSMRLGNIPLRMDVVVGLEKLAQLIEHDDANLTATVQAGMTIGALQKILGQRRQFLPVDPPYPSRATIGGIVAANTNGPRRMMYGGVRDLVVGMKVVLATGERIKAGGKVVKNVAGYDLCKLFIGSLGTLGIVTEATFRMAPLPERTASFVASGPMDRLAQFADDLSSSPLLPAAVTVLGPGAIEKIFRYTEASTIAIWLEGFEEAVARHLRDLETMTERAGLAGEILGEESHQRLWEMIRNFGCGDAGVLYRMTVPAGSVAEILAAVDRLIESGRQARYAAHPAVGSVYVSTTGDRAGLEWFPKLAELARAHKGHAVIAAAPAELKDGVDVWGPAPPGLGLMREIKRRFDPQGMLNPGRFVGGL